MIDQWGAIVEFGDVLTQLFLLAILCSIRFFVIFSIFPATSEQALQGRVRSGIVVILGLFIAGGQSPALLSRLSGSNLFTLCVKEAFLGILLGYMASTVFWIAEGVGALIDNVAGYNNIQQQNPLSSSQSTPLSSLLLQLCVTLFYVFGGFLVFVEVIFDTFRWWPLDSLVPLPAVVLERFIIFQTDTLMTQILKIVSPMLLIMVLIDLTFGLIAKTAGKLEPNSLAQPVKSSVALLLLILSLSVFIQQLGTSLSLIDFRQNVEVWMTGVHLERKD